MSEGMLVRIVADKETYDRDRCRGVEDMTLGTMILHGVKVPAAAPMTIDVCLDVCERDGRYVGGLQVNTASLRGGRPMWECLAELRANGTLVRVSHTVEMAGTLRALGFQIDEDGRVLEGVPAAAAAR